MLLNSLYTIGEICQKDSNTFQCSIQLNAEHAIFQGHFPARPILPGVCMIEIVKDAIKAIKHLDVSIESASTIKYLHVVDPTVDTSMNVHLSFTEEKNSIAVSVVSYLNDGRAHFKFKGICLG